MRQALQHADLPRTAHEDTHTDQPAHLCLLWEGGLVVIRLDNTHGKSTCLNSIAYALGMEKGIGATNPTRQDI